MRTQCVANGRGKGGDDDGHATINDTQSLSPSHCARVRSPLASPCAICSVACLLWCGGCIISPPVVLARVLLPQCSAVRGSSRLSRCRPLLSSPQTAPKAERRGTRRTTRRRDGGDERRCAR